MIFSEKSSFRTHKMRCVAVVLAVAVVFFIVIGYVQTRSTSNKDESNRDGMLKMQEVGESKGNRGPLVQYFWARNWDYLETGTFPSNAMVSDLKSRAEGLRVINPALILNGRELAIDSFLGNYYEQNRSHFIRIFETKEYVGQLPEPNVYLFQFLDKGYLTGFELHGTRQGFRFRVVPNESVKTLKVRISEHLHGSESVKQPYKSTPMKLIVWDDGGDHVLEDEDIITDQKYPGDIVIFISAPMPNSPSKRQITGQSSIEQVTIEVKALTGDTFSVKVERGAKLSDVKNKLHYSHRIPKDGLKYIAAGKELEDHEEISNDILKSRAFILLVGVWDPLGKEVRIPNTEFLVIYGGLGSINFE